MGITRTAPPPPRNCRPAYTLTREGCSQTEGCQMRRSFMAAYSSRLPARLPEGTKYIVEGRLGGGFSRYIEFPDGTLMELPAAPAKSRPGRRVQGRRPTRRR